MTVFDKLEKLYIEIDTYYSLIEFNASRRRWRKVEQSVQEKRKQNDEAYFLFFFSRLEDRIRVESSKLIRRMQSSRKPHKSISAWLILPPDPDNEIYFKKRLELLIDKGSADFALICQYYNHRNSIAHGGHFVSPVSMPTAVNEFKRLYGLLKA